jgi:hypothetical protein
LNVGNINVELAFGVEWPIFGACPIGFHVSTCHFLKLTRMNQFELSPSPPAGPATRLREAACHATVPLPQIRDLSRLVADIRRARELLDAAGGPAAQISIQDVIEGDPRD